MRPDNVTAYADSDSISDSETVPNPLIFSIPTGKQGDIYSIDNIYVQRHSGNGVDISIFTLFMNLFVDVPPTAVNDNSPFIISDGDSANWIGEFSFSSQNIFGRNTVMRSISPLLPTFKLGSDLVLYALLRTGGIYNPQGDEEFVIKIHISQLGV